MPGRAGRSSPWPGCGAPASRSAPRDPRLSPRSSGRLAAPGMTQRDLGRALGVSQRTVLGWEKAERRPDEAVLARVAEILAGARSVLEDGMKQTRSAA